MGGGRKGILIKRFRLRDMAVYYYECFKTRISEQILQVDVFVGGTTILKCFQTIDSVVI